MRLRIMLPSLFLGVSTVLSSTAVVIPMPEGIHTSLVDAEVWIAWTSAAGAEVQWKKNGVIQTSVSGSAVGVAQGPAGTSTRTTSGVGLGPVAAGDLIQYKVGPASWHSVSVPPADAVRIVFYGDIGRTVDSTVIQNRILSLDPPPDLVIALGDLAYQTDPDEQPGVDHTQEWDAFMSNIEPLARSILWMPVAGNHEYPTPDGEESGGGEGATAYQYTPRMVLPGGAPLGDNEHFYTLRVGPVKLVLADSNLVCSPWSAYAVPCAFGIGTVDQDRLEWLEDETSNPEGASFVLVGMHHSPFTRHSHYGTTETTLVRDNWVPVFESSGVDLVVGAHAHLYERTDPIDGVTYVTTGGGGHEIYGCGPYAHSWTEICSSKFHFTVVDADSNTLSWAVYEKDDPELDDAIDTWCIGTCP